MKMEFNTEQLEAIQSDAQRLLVLAGAGTGKTRTIIGRTSRLIEDGIDPSRIVIVTFTRRAAHEIRSRLSESAGPVGRKVITGTFHNFCLRNMNARRRWFALSDVTLMDRDDQLQLMKLVRAELVGKNAMIPQANTLVNYYSYARNTNQAPQEYLEKYTDLDAQAVPALLKIFEAYKQRKKANSYLDYDDILHRFAKVLHDNDEVCQRVCTQYDHVLVDEMQDTNPLQWLILESMAKHCNLFCVGDDAQSIYAFRGADFRNVHSFEKRLPGSQTLKLEMNYRSTQPILDVANWLLQQSELEFDKTLTSIRGDGDRPALLDFDSEFDEAEWIVERIKHRKIEGASWSQNMILCRTAFSARPIEAQLIEQKIPYRFVGGISLLQMAHVKDLLSVLRVILNHRDELAWMRFLTLWPRIGEVSSGRILGQIILESSTPEAIRRLNDHMPKRPEIAKVPQSVMPYEGEPAQAIKVAAKQLQTVLEARYDRWDARQKDFELLARLAANHRSLQAFLETYTLDPISATDVDPSQDAEDGVVTLITVHSAKGTEADVCFVAAAQPGNYPHTRSLGDEDAVEEERRVLYVALTRARDELLITRSLSRGFARVSWNASQGSQYFLDDLPGSLVEWNTRMAGMHRTVKPIEGFYDDDDVIG